MEVIEALDNPSRIPNEEYRQADFIELLCLTALERMLTAHDIKDVYREEAGLNKESAFPALLDSQKLEDGTPYAEDLYYAQLEDWFSYLDPSSKCFWRNVSFLDK